MPMICLHDYSNKDSLWINTDHIAYIRHNKSFTDRHLAVVGFVDPDNPKLSHIDERHVRETPDEIMTMVDAPALLAQKIRE